MKAVVFGSFVVDLMARTPHLPTPGETVKGSVFKLGPEEKALIRVDEESADRAAEYFFGQGVKVVIITLGAKGVYINDGKKKGIMPAFKVNVIDTTCAGDAFNGGLLAGLTEGMDLWEASRFACAVAAISVQRLGTALSMPRREEIDDFLSKH